MSENISGQLLGSLHRPVLIFQPTVYSSAIDSQSKLQVRIVDVHPVVRR
jgi:hypothetical protein